MKRNECEIGQHVVYRREHIEAEIGIVASMNDSYAFVRYGDEWQAKATRYEDLHVDQEGRDE